VSVRGGGPAVDEAASAGRELSLEGLLRGTRGSRSTGPRGAIVEFELLQLGGHEDLVRAASGGSPARTGLGVEPIELLVVVQRVMVEEEEAPCLGEPSEGEHVAEAGVPPADVTRVLVVGVLAIMDEERRAVCQVEARERLPFARAERWGEGEFLVRDVAERRVSLGDPVAEGGAGVGDEGCLDACGPDLPLALRAGAEGDPGRELVQVDRRERRGEVAGEAVAQRLSSGWAPDDDLRVGREQRCEEQQSLDVVEV